jgi:NAD(P)H-flavin reductase
MSKTIGQPHAISPSTPMRPFWAEIVEIVHEAPGVSTYWLQFLDPALRVGYHFKAGQFNMLTMPGLGESAISISSDMYDTRRIGHTIRVAGNVTSAISHLKVGDTLGVRGPFGSWWGLDACVGKDIVMSAGGIGLPPLRPVLYHVMRHRQDFGRVVLLYGARTPNDLQFAAEYKAWQDAGIEVTVTVDRGDDTWEGRVGVVPILFYNTRVNPRNTVILTCGPEIMIRFVIFEALARRVPPERIFVSLERNMKCGLGSCGHCQLGPFFICKDGPVFSFEKLQPYVNVEEF